MIQKAGAILTRTHSTHQREIYLIHRLRYDDWSLPKGHVEEGESLEAAAIRETQEETGFMCRVVRALPEYVYQLPNGEYSVVHFFECVVVGENPAAKDAESDRGEWMSLSDACDRISYPSLKRYLLTVLS